MESTDVRCVGTFLRCCNTIGFQVSRIASGESCHDGDIL